MFLTLLIIFCPLPGPDVDLSVLVYTYDVEHKYYSLNHDYLSLTLAKLSYTTLRESVTVQPIIVV